MEERACFFLNCQLPLQLVVGGVLFGRVNKSPVLAFCSCLLGGAFRSRSTKLNGPAKANRNEESEFQKAGCAKKK